MSTQRVMQGGRADRAEMPRGSGGHALCRWCAVEVPPRRQTFCSDRCVHEWRLRSNPGYLRQQAFARDRGVCHRCRIDCMEAFRRLKRSRGDSRKAMLDYWGLQSMTRKSLWDADHILPVCEGGGECDLLNIRTLCLACHRDATFDLHRRRRSAVARVC
ncbi:MAG: HNH endonuclease [Acidobacteriaceae bacterium]